MAINLPNQPNNMTQARTSQQPPAVPQVPEPVQQPNSALNSVGKPYSVSGQVPSDKPMEQQQNMKCGGPAKFIRRGH